MQEPRTTWRDRLRTAIPAIEGIDRRTAIILTAGALLLLLFKKLGTPGQFRDFAGPLRDHPRIDVFSDLWWFFSSLLLLGIIPYCTLTLLGVRGEERGTAKGDAALGLRWVLILYAIMLPVIGIASQSKGFWSYYPINRKLAEQAVTWAYEGEPASWLMWIAIYEVGYAMYFLGWEYFYRAFLTLALERKLGIHAVLVANVPFALMHAGKPLPEALGSIVAGLALGLFALRTRSFWYCWLLHAMIACSMDLLCLGARIGA
jgi:uncharacterized protein